MAIKRISELDQFGFSDLSQFLSTDGITDSSVARLDENVPDQEVFDQEKLTAGLWLEVSTPLNGLSCYDVDTNKWAVKPANEEPSYYVSKKISAGELGSICTSSFQKAIKSIISGPINLYGSQNFGDPIEQLNDGTDSVWFDPRAFLPGQDETNPNRLCVMVSADFTNQTVFHNKTGFHNQTEFTGQNGSTIFHPENTENHSWAGQYVNLSGPWTEFGQDIAVHGTAFLENLEAGQSHFKNLSVDNDIYGCCLSAKWADLAENYQADFCLSPGTLVEFGGEAEVTVARKTVNAVVTTKPGVVLNKDAGKHSVGLALIGRVPVRVIGKVKKFDKIGLSCIPGVGKKVSFGRHIGIALESSDIEKEKLIECVVQLVL